MTKLLSVTQAAERLNVAPITVRRLLASGKIPHHKVGDRRLFSEGDIQAFLDSCAIPAKGVDNE